METITLDLESSDFWFHLRDALDASSALAPVWQDGAYTVFMDVIPTLIPAKIAEQTAYWRQIALQEAWTMVMTVGAEEVDYVGLPSISVLSPDLLERLDGIEPDMLVRLAVHLRIHAQLRVQPAPHTLAEDEARVAALHAVRRRMHHALTHVRARVHGGARPFGCDAAARDETRPDGAARPFIINDNEDDAPTHADASSGADPTPVHVPAPTPGAALIVPAMRVDLGPHASANALRAAWTQGMPFTQMVSALVPHGTSDDRYMVRAYLCQLFTPLAVAALNAHALAGAIRAEESLSPSLKEQLDDITQRVNNAPAPRLSHEDHLVHRVAILAALRDPLPPAVLNEGLDAFRARQNGFSRDAAVVTRMRRRQRATRATAIQPAQILDAHAHGLTPQEIIAACTRGPEPVDVEAIRTCVYGTIIPHVVDRMGAHALVQVLLREMPLSKSDQAQVQSLLRAINNTAGSWVRGSGYARLVARIHQVYTAPATTACTPDRTRTITA